MRRGLAVLCPPDVQRGIAAELDLRPFQIANLHGPQTVPVREQDQCRIAKPVAAIASRLDEPF